MRILGKSPISIINVYRPPIRRAPDNDRADSVDPSAFPSGDDVIILGDFNAHHPRWDNGCDAADSVGQRLADWLDRISWTPLNSGEPTHASSSGGSSAPDAAFCSRVLSWRTSWTRGTRSGQ